MNIHIVDLLEWQTTNVKDELSNRQQISENIEEMSTLTKERDPTINGRQRSKFAAWNGNFAGAQADRCECFKNCCSR